MLDLTEACLEIDGYCAQVGVIERVTINTHHTGESMRGELTPNLIHRLLAMILALSPLVAAAYLDSKQKHQP